MPENRHPRIVEEYAVHSAAPREPLFTRVMPITIARAPGVGLLVPVRYFERPTADDRPRLRVSPDDTLAVDADGLSQHIYVTREVHERAVRELAASGSRVSLTLDTEVSLTLAGAAVPAGGDVPRPRLFRVTADLPMPQDRLGTGLSRDFNARAAGAAVSDLVFRTAETAPVTAPVTAASPVEITGTHHLAEALAQVANGTRDLTEVTPRWAALRVGEDDRGSGTGHGPLAGQAYGSALALTEQPGTRRARLTTAARFSGVNEFAWARVGESYAVQSIGAAGREGVADLKADYARSPRGTVGEFGHHFAHVVLASADGSTQVTLELGRETSTARQVIERAVTDNLARWSAAELRAGEAALRRELAGLRKSGARRDAMALRHRLDFVAALSTAKTAQDAADRVPEGGAYADAEAVGVSEAVVRARRAGALPDAGECWFFRMAHRGPGGSFHDLYARQPGAGSVTGGLANPLTVVARHGGPDPSACLEVRVHSSLSLAPQAAREVAAVADTVTRTAIWNARHGVAPPTVTVRGAGAAGRRHLLSDAVAGPTALEAAQEVCRLLRQRIAVRLGELLPEGSALAGASAEVTAETLDIRAESAQGSAGQAAESGLRALIEVSDGGGLLTLRRPLVPTAVPAEEESSAVWEAGQVPGGGHSVPDSVERASGTSGPAARTSDPGAEQIARLAVPIRPHRALSVEGEGDRFLEALIQAIRANEPQLLADGAGLAQAIGPDGPLDGAVQALIRSAGGQVSDDQVPLSARLLDPQEAVSLGELGQAMTIPAGLRVMAELAGGTLKVSEARLSRADQFRVLLVREGGRSTTVSRLIGAMVAAELGVRLLVEPAPGDGTHEDAPASSRDFGHDAYGPPEGVPLLLIKAEGVYAAAVWSDPLPSGVPDATSTA